ncbi:hypothetical protein HPY42_01595 [Coprothermobacteraceae bacterium]|nr:hypothetical protein [Coprothermobacteraceae bacterium]
MKVKFVYSPIYPNYASDIESAKRFFAQHGVTLEENEQPEALVFLSGGSEEVAKSYLRAGVLLLPFGTANGLAASLEVQSYASEQGIPVFLISELDNIRLQWLRTLDSLRKEKAGIIGKPSDWLIKSGDTSILEELMVPYAFIPLEELSEHLTPDMDLAKEVMSRASHTFITEQEVIKATSAYKALVEIVRKHGLSAFALRCFDMAVNLKITGCLALALFNAQGRVATCEGDIETMATMMLARHLAGTPGFMANLARRNGDLYTFAHCTVSLDLVQEYALNTHFETGYNVGVQGTLPIGVYTGFRIGKGKKFKYFVGEAVPSEHVEHMCRTQITLRIEGSPFLQSIGNHIVLLPGDLSKELEALKDFGWTKV